jgi:tetratricopeptide (TPR) repeat protein
MEQKILANMNSFQRSSRAALVCILLASACQNVKPTGPKEGGVVALVRDARYAQAVSLAQEILDKNPDSVQANRNLHDASLALLISQGRDKTLQRDSEEGLDLFYRARELDGGNEVVRDWINKTRIQLAEDALTMSGTMNTRDELAERQEMLIRVLKYLPENEGSERVNNLRMLAVSSLKRVEENLAYCKVRSQEAFDAGRTSLAKGNHHEAMHEFATALLYDKEQVDAVDLFRHAGVMVAGDLLADALRFEEAGLYDAARMEFERVHGKAPGNLEAIEGLNRMEREVRTGRILEEAEMAMLRGTPELAGKLLDEAQEMTRMQRNVVDNMRDSLLNTKWESMYERALALEVEGRLTDAVVAFEALLSAAGEFKDSSSRKRVSEELIAKADGLYLRAADAKNEADEYSLLREIQIFWPRYLDVSVRVERLQESLDASEAMDDEQAMDAEDAEVEPSEDGELPRRAPMGRKATPKAEDF